MESYSEVNIGQDTYVAHNALNLVIPYLKLKDVLRLAQVCKLWNEIIFNNSIWKNITLQNLKFDFGAMINFIVQRNTERLILQDCDYAQKDLTEFSVPLLKELEVCEFKTFVNYRKKETQKSIDLKFLENMKSLEKLILNTKRSLTSTNSISPNLKHLTIISYEDFVKASLKYKINFSNLEYLELFGIDTDYLEACLEKLTKLKTLRIGNSSNVFCNSSIYWEKLRLIKELPSFKELELINFKLDFKDLAKCDNLEKLTYLPHPSMVICGGVEDLKDSHLKNFVLAISEDHFQQLIPLTVHSFQRARSFYPPWDDIPFQPEMLNKLLAINFKDQHFPNFPILVNAIIERKMDIFLTTLQNILQKTLPNIEVSVIKFEDKWSEHEGIQWGPEYS